MPKGERSRKSWAMPILAAAAVVAIGVAVGAVATRHPVTRPPAASPAGDQESTGPAGAPGPADAKLPGPGGQRHRPERCRDEPRASGGDRRASRAHRVRQ